MAALFQDSVANALKTLLCRQPGSLSIPGPIQLSYLALAALTVSTTFKLRAGPSSAVTLTFNGENAAAQFNGTFNSFMEIEEIVT